MVKIKNISFLLSIFLLVGCGSDDSSSTASTTTTTTTTATTVVHKGLSYTEVTSPHTNRIWLDRNMGATRVCQASDDASCFGDYYQWGRETDGHQLKTSTAVNSTESVVTGTGSNMMVGSQNWSTADSNGSERKVNWNSTNGNSVCPAGYHVPKITDIQSELFGLGTINGTTIYGSFLKLPYAGFREPADGNLTITGTVGNYWSQDQNTSSAEAYALLFTPTGVKIPEVNYRAYAMPVRCIKP